MEPIDTHAVDALEEELRAALSPEAAFLMATDSDVRHNPAAEVIAYYGAHLWTVFTTGTLGLLLAEAGKDAAGAVGKGLGEAVVARIKRWIGAPPAKPDDEAESRRLLAESNVMLAEAMRGLSEELRRSALDRGATAVREQLIEVRFPGRRADALAESIRAVGARRYGG